jgi:hypothetical protein
MNTPWKLCRTTVAQPDGERRWDNAYQLLLQWAMEDEAEPDSVPSYPQEDCNGSRPLRSCLYPPSTTAADD